MNEGYYALDERTAIDYARACAPIHALLPPGESLLCEEIGDGNLNLIFRIVSARDRARSVIIKQALPYVRLVGESWPLSPERARIESDALSLQAQLCPGLVPQLYHYEPALYLTVMEDLRDAVIMRKGLIAGQRYPNFAQQIAEFLAQTLFKTSDLFLDSAAKKQAVIRFSNPELCTLTEPARIAALRANEAVLREVRWLKWAFMTRAEALIHGDLHTGSIMVTPKRAWVIDPEFAFYGPLGFDIGAVLGNLVIAYAAQPGHNPDHEQHAAYQEYLLQTLAEVWQGFATRFDALWRAHD